VWASPQYADLNALREAAAASYDCCYYPQGASRHLAVMIVSGSRAAGFRRLAVRTTLVIRDVDEPL
jgi:hypothetical protein